MVTSIIFSFVVFPCLVFAQEGGIEEPSKFNFGSIPFGESVEEVLKKVDGASVKEITSRGIKLISFRLGTTPFDDFPIFEINYGLFSGEFVKGYEVVYKKWKKIQKIKLLFIKEVDSPDIYTLFIVKKSFKRKERFAEIAFTRMMRVITGKVGINPKVSLEHMEESPFAGKVLGVMIGIWRLNSIKIFLIVGEGKFPLDVIYISNSGWKKYIDCKESYKKNLYQKDKEGKGKEIKDLNDEF